jgi:hypothetical protein
MTRRAILAFGLYALVSARLAGAPQDLTTADNDSMTAKVLAVLTRGQGLTAPSTSPVQTSFTERELNAFFKFSGPSFLPVGVLGPAITILGPGRLQGRAVVDLDAVRKSQPPRSVFDPLGYLMRGTVEVKAAGAFQASNGVATFQLESATCAGIPIPKSLLQEFVTYYSRTPDAPNGIDIDKPFPLPAQIREIHTQKGAATVIQ